MISIKKNSLSYTRQVITLALSGSVFSVTLFFCWWLYQSSRNSVEEQVASDLVTAENITTQLVKLKINQLRFLAKSIVEDIRFKSSLVTNHDSTIEDGLKDMAIQYKLSFVVLLKKRRIQYAGMVGPYTKDMGRKALFAGHFLGVFPVDDGRTLVVGKRINNQDLKLWSEMTHVKYGVYNQNTLYIENVKNSPLSRSFSDSGPLSRDGLYYVKNFALMKGTLKMVLYKEKGPYWKAFTKKRNTLFLVAIVVFVIGIIFSFPISAILIGALERNQQVQVIFQDNMQNIIKDIEKIKLERT